jgi:VWFA-related protein
MSLPLRFLSLFLAVQAVLFVASAQNGVPTPSASQSAALPILRARAKLVVVDVVVTDRYHQPVKNLKAEDFSVFEDKSQQKITSFEEHTALSPGEALKFSVLPKLPPGVFTNITPAPVNSAINILLIDSLNTPLNDQIYLREEILKYLETVHSGTSIAIFGLSNRMVMLQGFTSDPEVLRTAARNVKNAASPLIPERMGGGGETETIADTAGAFGTGSGALSGDAQANLALLVSQVQSTQLQLRARITLDSLNLLARYLSGIPGRKNLVWFSGAFPLDLRPDHSESGFNPFFEQTDAGREYRETVNLMARAQVAVYPVDVRGVIVSPSFQAASAAAIKDVTPISDKSDVQNAIIHETMSRLAEDTGGHSFYNLNNLSEAMDQAITEGANYYTLAYTPTNGKWHGDFRRIEIKVPEHKATLAYRHGYYAVDPDSKITALTSSAPPAPDSRASGERAMERAMGFGVPAIAGIRFKTRVLPAKGLDDKAASGNSFTVFGSNEAHGSFKRLVVDFDTEGHDFDLTANPDGTYHLEVQFAALVSRHGDGRLVNSMSSTIRSDLSAQQRTAILNGGLPFRFQVSVPPKGEYTLRLGVRDLNSDRIGSMEIPVTTVIKLPEVEIPLPPAPPARTAN